MLSLFIGQNRAGGGIDECWGIGVGEGCIVECLVDWLWNFLMKIHCKVRYACVQQMFFYHFIHI
jgi:hypothetical protein